MFKKFSLPAKAATLSLCIAQLIACGGTGQDEGTASTYNQEFRGLVIDGYLARATVFMDSNNNGTRDPWETWAFTDNQGYYSYNPNTDTNYCAAAATAQQQQYCLRGNIEYANVVIRIDSGYDVTTGEPFLGQLSRRINVAEEETNSIVSPISSLLTNIENSDNRSALLAALNVAESDLDVNYINTNGSGEFNAHLLNTNLKIHKVVSVLSDRLTDTYSEIGDDVGTPNDATSSIYQNLAQQIIASESTLGETLAAQTNIVNILDNSQQMLRQVYQQKDLDMPANISSDAFSRTVEVAQGVAKVVDTLVPNNSNISSMTELKGIARSIESLVVKAQRETELDESIDKAISFFTDQSKQDLVQSLVNTLGQDSADFAALSRHSFNLENLDTVEKIDAAFSLPADALPFSAIGGMQLRVSDLDLGTAPDDLSDTEIELYFNGETTSLEGSFSACVKYINGANAESLGEGNTRGELVSGFWSLLGATNENKSYSLLITLSMLGTTYQSIIKPAGFETINGTEYNLLRFDYDDEFGSWHSPLGLTEIQSTPSSNQECEERLPSRVGLERV